jgi:phage-related protein
MIIPLPQCQKEMSEFPEEIRGDIADALARLNEGLTLAMPLSRPMPSIGPCVHELRFRDRAGSYRVIYVLFGGASVYLIHAFMKKTARTSKQNIELAQKRLKGI